jgi:hypothetical protein
MANMLLFVVKIIMKVVFLNTYYYAAFQDVLLSVSNVTSTSQVHASAMWEIASIDTGVASSGCIILEINSVLKHA